MGNMSRRLYCKTSRSFGKPTRFRAAASLDRFKFWVSHKNCQLDRLTYYVACPVVQIQINWLCCSEIEKCMLVNGG